MTIWKPVEGYEGLYEVSDEGVRSIKNGIMKITYSGRYPNIGLYKKGVKKHSIHRLVAIAFIPNPYNLPEVDHKNNNKKDFRADNLQWVTRKQNMKKAYSDNIIPSFWEGKKGKSHPKSKRVLQKTIGGMTIKEWDNTLIASKELKIQQPSISKVCSGKRVLAGGFKWEYL